MFDKIYQEAFNEELEKIALNKDRENIIQSLSIGGVAGGTGGLTAGSGFAYAIKKMLAPHKWIPTKAIAKPLAGAIGKAGVAGAAVGVAGAGVYEGSKYIYKKYKQKK